MLSFISSLSPNGEAIAIFVNAKYEYKDREGILPDNMVHKINSFLSVKVKKKYKSYSPQESGGSLFSYIKKNKNINKIVFCPDSLDFGTEEIVNFFSQFIFAFLNASDFNNPTTTADPAMSYFISSINFGGFNEIPPV